MDIKKMHFNPRKKQTRDKYAPRRTKNIHIFLSTVCVFMQNDELYLSLLCKINRHCSHRHKMMFKCSEQSHRLHRLTFKPNESLRLRLRINYNRDLFDVPMQYNPLKSLIISSSLKTCHVENML